MELENVTCFMWTFNINAVFVITDYHDVKLFIWPHSMYVIVWNLYLFTYLGQNQCDHTRHCIQKTVYSGKHYWFSKNWLLHVNVFLEMLLVELSSIDPYFWLVKLTLVVAYALSQKKFHRYFAIPWCILITSYNSHFFFISW